MANFVYVYVSVETGKFVSPVIISKFLEQKIGDFEAKRETDKVLIKIKQNLVPKIEGAIIEDTKLVVTYNQKLNTSQGVVFYPTFNYVKDDEIIQELSEQGVTTITRFLKKGDATKYEEGTKVGFKNSGLFLLNFNRTTRPFSLNFCHERIEVKTYYPNPMRCNNCFRYGHKSVNCRSNKKCGKCSNDYHDQCNENLKCCNCQESHPAWSRDCAVYTKEKEIIKYATDNKVSYKEARQRQQTNTRITSYAQKVKADEESAAQKKEIEELRKLNQDLLKELQSIRGIRGEEQHAAPKPHDQHKKIHTPAQDHLNQITKELQKEQQTIQTPAVNSRPQIIYDSDIDMSDDTKDTPPPEDRKTTHQNNSPMPSSKKNTKKPKLDQK